MVKAKKKSKKQVVRDKPKPVSKPPRNKKGQLLTGWGKGSKQIKKKVKKVKPARRPNGTLLPGNTANPDGVRIGHINKLDSLLKAIARVQDDKNKSLLDHFVERAFESDNVMIALLKKLHPDLRAIEMQTLPGDDLPDDEAEKIREEMSSRFGH